MSSIFRAPYDDSIADSIEDSENDVANASANDNHASTDSIPRSSLQTPLALARLNSSHPQLPNIQPHQHSTLFYLSLIEGRCRTQAASALNAGRRPEEHLPENHPEVHGLAQHLFGEMTKELHKAGVLPDEFAGQELREIRRKYLSSFDAILNNIAAKRTDEFQDNNTYSSLFDRSNAYAIGGDLLSTSFSNAKAFALQRYTMASGTRELIPAFPSLSLGDTAYKTQYKELYLLGKGGFGKVYKAFHKLDKCDYAIKKVVIGADMLGGRNQQAKAEELLSELRILARLNHRNIVRYHHSWAENQPPKLQGDSSSASESEEEPEAPGPRLKDVKDMKAGRTKFEQHLDNHLTRESRHSRQVSRMMDESQDSIVFAHSASSTKTAGASNGQNQSRSEEKALVNAKKSFFRSPNSPEDTDSDDTADSEDSIDNEPSTEEVPFATEVVQSLAARFDITLFIQMSLHPMNLEDYLWPDQQKPAETQIEHCYHTLPTARILLGVLDGVEYIHRHNIVHRDLKPSNIMLSVSEKAASLLDGSIKVNDCPDCRGNDSKELYLTPHIGDFGLVADIQDPESEPSLIADNALISNAAITPTTAAALNTDNKLIIPPALSGLSSFQPGTRFYRPPNTPKGKAVICPKVDVYSLGVIALEMIYQFATRSERAFELDKLKDGIFPQGFENHEMTEGIKYMLCKERDQRWGCAEVRKWLNTIIETAKGAEEASTLEKANEA